MASRRMVSRRTITGSLSDVQKRLKYVEGRSTPSRLATQVVRRTNVQPRAISTDQIALSSINNSLIEEGTIRASELATNAVGNDELAPNSVDTENFIVGAVDNSALGPGAVTQDKLADDSVGQDQIIDGSVGTIAIIDGAITTGKILDGAINTSKLNNFAVTTDKIGPGAIVDGKIAIDAISSGTIQNGAITGGKISNGAVTSAKIGGGQVQTTNIADRAVTRAKIGTGAVGAVQIATGSVDAARISSGSSIATQVNVAGGLNRSTFSGGSFGGTAYTLSVRFGGGSNEVARGNHTHPISSSNSAGTTTGPSAGTTHTHGYAITNVPFSTGTPSTKRVKKDISDYELDDPKKILNLQPKKYKYKNSLRAQHSVKNRNWLYGYIAEDVLEIGLEELVGYDKKGKPNSLDYSLISLFLVELAKVHQTEIDSLKSEVQRLKEER